MKFTLEIGDNEKSRVEFSRNSFTGAMQATVDGEQVAQQSPYSPSTHFNFRTKERPWLFAGFRPQTYRVFVDGKMVHEQTGY